MSLPYPIRMATRKKTTRAAVLGGPEDYTSSY